MISSLLAIIGATPLAGEPASPPQFAVAVLGNETTCRYEANGQPLTIEELEANAKAAANANGRASVSINTTDAPWRCVAGAIYRMQMAGLREIEMTPFVAEPPPKR